jgi:hypothetical protein
VPAPGTCCTTPNRRAFLVSGTIFRYSQYGTCGMPRCCGQATIGG